MAAGIRRGATKTQTKLSPDQKILNVKNAFPVRKGVSFDRNISHILLIDDVFTTGATLYACFVALRSVFPTSVRISVATLGFVGEV